MDTFDPEYDAPLFYCCVCARELRRNSCRKCGTEDNTPTNWIPNGKKERPTPAPSRPADDAECYCGRYAKEHSIGDGCGNFTPRPADDARPMVTGGGLIKFVRDETKGGPRG